jgi:pimeloyl-ACP methyl ester carboxylesterase
MNHRQTVVTVHGVNTSGDWQEQCVSILEPHFRTYAIKYPDYNTLWKTIDVAFAKWWLILGLLSLLLPGRLYIAPPLFLISLLLAARKRRAVAFRLKKDLDAGMKSTEPPHLIGHSFGTYLAGSWLRLFEHQRFGRLILVGAVLPRLYPWEVLFHRRGGRAKFESVRNETGKKDFVVFLASLTFWVPRLGVGSAGLLGFRKNLHFIHSVRTTFGPCSHCLEMEARGLREETARVHNYPLTEYEHSDAFLSEDHARKLWLPTLWGFAPADFEYFGDLCRLLCGLEAEGRAEEAGQIEDELRSLFLRWPGVFRASHAPFIDHVVSAVRFRFPTIQSDRELKEAANRAIRLICRAFYEADVENRKPLQERSASVALALHPLFALGRGVEGAGA